MPAKFRHPKNGHTETVSDLTWLWVLLFGCLFFVVKGNWRHALAGFGLAVLTVGVSWLVYPFFAYRIMKTHYLRMGWERVKKAKPVTTFAP